MKTLKHEDTESKTVSVMRPPRKGVILTIAREHGSSGKQIGKIVAEKLDIPFYYKEMTALAAQESGLDQEFISDTVSYTHLHAGEGRQSPPDPQDRVQNRLTKKKVRAQQVKRTTAA